MAIRGLGARSSQTSLEGARDYMHLLVAVDKFTKWIEARPISVINSEQAMLFFLDIVHCFGLPNSIISDNST